MKGGLNGHFRIVVKLLEQVIKIQETVLAKYHPYRLASQLELAGAYQVNGQVKEAVEWLQ